MKAIMMSIRPEWCVEILNGKKTIEVRKKFPKDFRGWVYIYCTKGLPLFRTRFGWYRIARWVYDEMRFRNGKVLGRFWVDNVEEYYNAGRFIDEPKCELDDICEKACLSRYELDEYCEGSKFVAIYISKLETFDKTKKLSEFKRPKWSKCGVKDKNGLYQCDKCPYGKNWTTTCEYDKPIKAPQNYCYVEVEK